LQDLVQARPWDGTERYEVRQCLGRGSMGVVYEVFDRERAELLAAKTVREFDPLSLYLFKQEFRALADVRHPNLVRFYEFVQRDEGEVFFTMERVYGVDFLQYVRGTTVDLVRLRRALRQLVEGVSAVHAAGKLHRDVKPSNVLVTGEGRVVLLDFGVSTQLVTRSSTVQIPSGELVGSAEYMAPEQGDAGPPVAASDWYSVGIMLYEALVGRPPFTGSLLDILAKKCNADPEPPSKSVPGVPADLDALCLALLSRFPEQRPDGAEILCQLGNAPSTVPPRREATSEVIFVGRAAPLETLQRAFDASREGALVAVRVSGEPGMGKSFLVNRFVGTAERDAGALVLEGRSYEREAVPYKAIDGAIDALSDLLVHLEDNDEAIRLPDDIWVLAQLFPVLRRIPSVAEDVPRPVVDPISARRTAFAALRALLTTFATQSPLILFLDDVHWGDVDSANLLLDLMRPPGVRGLLVVMTQREDEAKESAFCRALLDRWPASVTVHDLTIGPLECDEAQSLALAKLDASDPSSPAIARAVARESGGSPLLIEELARSNRAVQAATGGDAPAVLSLEEMVSERLEKLPPEARVLLETIAVAGHPMLTSVIGAASDQETVEQTVALLVSRRFVRTVLRGQFEGVEIIHGRIAESIAALLDADVLRAKHQALLRVLGATPGTDPEQIALHARGAGDTAIEAKFSELGAEQAFRALAFDRAARLFRRVVDLLPRSSPDLPRRRARLAEALKYAGRFEDSAEAYLAAAEGATPEKRLELRREAAHQLLMGGHIAKASGVLYEVLEAAGMRAPRSTAAAVFWLVVFRTWGRVLGARLPVLAEDQVPAARRLRIDALYTVVGGFSMVDPVVAACMQERHFIETLRGADAFRLLRAVVLEAAHQASAAAPETPRERALHAAIESLCEQAGTNGKLYADHVRGLACFQRGRWAEAHALLEREINRLPYGHPAMAMVRLYAIYTESYLGNVGRAIARARKLLTQAEEHGDLFTLVNLRTTTMATACLADDDPAAARAMIHAAIAQWPKTGMLVQHWQVMMLEAHLALYLGDGAAGRENFTRNWHRVKKSWLLHGAAVRIPGLYLRAELAIASIGNDPALAAQRIAEARGYASLLEKESEPWAAVFVALARAAADNASGDREGAMAKLRVAIERAETTSTRLYLPAARHRLGLLIGGDEGRRMTEQAAAAATAEGVRNPERWFATHLPGHWGI
jgi:tetratricopeptide (TPR) repeat protein